MKTSSYRRRYSEVKTLATFEDRYEYLRLRGGVGLDTFGHERYLNQRFYRSLEWKQTRDFIIGRDEASDLGVLDRPIYGRILIHHINPVTQDQILNGSDSLFDPENLITVTHLTHNAIHYGNDQSIEPAYVPRKPGDTKLW